jgi:hypothetical protein
MMKTLYINSTTDWDDWVLNHHNIIIETLYENIFDFISKDELLRTVLKVITHQIPIYDDNEIYIGSVYDFILVRSDIDETIDALIKNFEDAEDYEKCSELIKLKTQI